MQPHELIPWLGSLALESLLIFFILKDGIHKRFPTFFAYIIFDILRAIILPVFLYADPHSGGLYFYAYWLAIPIEYTLTFLIILEVFAYIFRAHIKHSRGVIRAFVIFGSVLLVISVTLILWPGVSFGHLTRLILTVNRSVSLLMSGLLFFMWTYSSRIGFTMRDHVWGIVFGLGLYSSMSLVVAAIHAMTEYAGPVWISALPHYAYLAATAIWNAYLWKPEPEVPPLTDEEFAQYQNLVSTYRTLLKNVRKALAR